jgi:uncharacterized repeat protein (TIGR01451 family)
LGERKTQARRNSCFLVAKGVWPVHGWNFCSLCVIGLTVAVGLALGNNGGAIKDTDGQAPRSVAPVGEVAAPVPPVVAKEHQEASAPPAPLPVMAGPQQPDGSALPSSTAGPGSRFDKSTPKLETSPASLPPGLETPTEPSAAAEAETNAPLSKGQHALDKPPALVPVAEAELAAAAAPAKPPAFRLIDPPTPPVEPAPVCPATIAAIEHTVAPPKSPETPVPAAATPAITLETVSAAEATVNQPFAYELVVRNIGSGPAQQVRVEEMVPPGVRLQSSLPPAERQGNRLAWVLGPMEAGAEKRIKIEAVLTQELEGLPAATVAYDVAPGQRLHCRPGSPAAPVKSTPVVLKVSSPGSVVVGQTAVFQIEVTNPGDVAATGLIVYDHLPDGLQHPQGKEIAADLAPLGPHETRNITLPTIAIKPGRHVNEISVVAPDGTKTRSEAAVEIKPGQIRVSLAGPPQILLGREMDYRIDVANGGATNAENVMVQDTLPTGLELVSADDGGKYDAATRTARWVFPMLPAGQTRTATLKVRATAPGNLVNCVAARPQDGEEVRTETNLDVQGVSSLTLDITNPDHQVEMDRETTYTVRVVNRGGVPASGVQVMATLPNGMVLRGATGQTQYRLQGQQVVFAPLARLEPGGNAVFRVTGCCQALGDLHFRVQLISDQSPQPLCQEEVTMGCSDKEIQTTDKTQGPASGAGQFAAEQQLSGPRMP